MRVMMFDLVKLRFELDLVFLLERVFHGNRAADVLDLLQDELWRRKSGRHKGHAPEVVYSRLAVDRDMIDLANVQARLAQTVVDRFRRQACPMLDPPETFFFRRGDEFPV